MFRLLDETLERVCAEKDEAEDSLGSSFVEYTIRNTVDQMARDLQDGTLSRSVFRNVSPLKLVIGSVLLNTAALLPPPPPRPPLPAPPFPLSLAVFYFRHSSRNTQFLCMLFKYCTSDL